MITPDHGPDDKSYTGDDDDDIGGDDNFQILVPSVLKQRNYESDDDD